MFSGKTIMIVEDSQTVRHEVRLLLEKTGIETVEAANELGMFNMMEQYGKTVDLIIMDLTLKFDNGFDLIKKLKNNSRYSNIPVIILTQHADMENVLKAKELGVNGYLRKPIQKEELISRVSSLLSDA